MNEHRKQIALGIVLLLVATVVVSWAGILAAGVFSSANASTQAALIGGLFAVVSLVFTYWKERTRSLKEAHRDKKIEVYSKFYDLMFGILERTKNSENLEDPDFDAAMAKSLFDVSRGVLFYGSPQVVSAFVDFRLANEGGNTDQLGIMKKVGRILLAMREDIGLSNRGLDELSVHQIYVNDDLRRLEAAR